MTRASPTSVVRKLLAAAGGAALTRRSADPEQPRNS